MINRYHEELEYDFDERGWDLLADVWQGGISLRKLWVRIRSLPRTSAFKRAVDPHGTRWTETDYLLARMVDTLHAVNGSTYRVPRPGSPEETAVLEKQQQITETRARSRAAFYERQRSLEGRTG